MPWFFIIVGFIFLLNQCGTPQSIGTDHFTVAWKACKNQELNFVNCMKLSQYSKQFTPAEHQLLSYYAMVIEKYKNGEISFAETEYYLTRYMNYAKQISNIAEAEQARSIGEGIGAAAALADNIGSRRCRAAGTC